MTSMFNPIVDDNFYISCYHPIPTVVPIAEVLFFLSKLVGGLEPWNFMNFHVLGIILPFD